MLQYIGSVRVEYVIGHWKVFENIRLADRHTDRFAFTKTETQFYKLGICLSIYCPRKKGRSIQADPWFDGYCRWIEKTVVYTQAGLHRRNPWKASSW